MSIQHPFGWDLPPGVTNADIERQAGADYDDCPDCEGSGRIKDDGAVDAVSIRCKRCDGEGFIDTTQEHAERQADAADREMDIRRDRFDDNEF